MSLVTPKMLKEVLNGSDVTAKDRISSSGNSYAEDHQSSRSLNRDIGHYGVNKVLWLGFYSERTGNLSKEY